MLSEEAKRIMLRDYAHLNKHAEVPIYPKPPSPKKEIVIDSITSIIEHKPSVKKVREYFSGVIENIREEWKSDFLP